MGNFKLEHVSYSSLNEYDQCPKKFYWNKVAGHKPKFNRLYFAFGHAVHEALAAYYEGKIPNSHPTICDPIAVFESAFEKEKDTIEYIKGETFEKALDIGRRLIKVFIGSGEKIWLQPKAVENWFTVDMANPLTGEKLGVKFKGIIDLVTVDDIVVEHKTSASEWKQERVDSELQTSGYALGFRLLTGRSPKAIVYNILVKQVRNPRFQTFITYRDEGKMVLFFEWAKDIVGKINYGLYPYNRGKRCRTCVYRDICI